MFKALRKKFIAISMVLLTSIVVLICASIYIITKNNSEALIFDQLTEGINLIKDIHSDDVATKGPELRDTILVVYDIKGEKVSYSSENNMENDVILSMIGEALKSDEEKGFIEASGYNFAYMYKKSPTGIEMSFKDSTVYVTTNKRLLTTLIVIGSISIILLYIVSLYIANKAIEPVEEAYNSQKRFIADASHELKTPLAVVKTNLEILNANRSDTIEQQYKWLGYISFQTDRMSKLVTNLLYLAKADNNEELGVKVDFNISDVIVNQLLSFEAVLYENNLEMDYDIQENIMFKGDKEGINQLVGILIDNAIKHSFKETTIKIEMKLKKNRINFSVTNKGETIPEEDISMIFERFYRVDKSRSREKGGYGLGLSIAKSIVEKCNGKLYVKSKDNVTSFVAELPIL